MWGRQGWGQEQQSQQQAGEQRFGHGGLTCALACGLAGDL